MMMTRMPRYWSGAATPTWAIAAVLLWVTWGDAAPVDVPEFETVEAMVAMRDGVKLHTLVFSPKGARDGLPILFLRTPYGIDGRTAMFQTSLKELADDGYLFVFQDIRGKFRSEGEFAMIRAPRDRADPKAIDEGTDAYDTIDWLIKNVRGHNGRVGMLGVSYDGWLTVMALLEPHPGAQGGLAPGVAGRHVPRRRFPPQRRVPAQLRVRIRRTDGEQPGHAVLPVRPP